MSNYLNTVNEDIKKYFEILCEEFPEFLLDYIDTPEMQKQAGIGVSCGTYYSKMYDQIWYSSLDHSVAVALIIWNFTKDKAQTLSGLFHDIATPVFKHTIDFMNKDYEKQESTEELTKKKIAESKEIMALLNRDGLTIEQVCDYKIYPIADNDTPMLSSDRLEYTLSNGLGATEKIWNLDAIEEVYKNIEVFENEKGIIELGFRDKEIAEKFVHTMSKLSCLYRRDRTIFTMQFLADVMKKMSDANLITVDDLYTLTEKDVMKRIEECKLGNISECYKKWLNAEDIRTSNEQPKDVYFVNIEKNKVRYINPLVKTESGFERLEDISDQAAKDIQATKDYKISRYITLDFILD